MPGLHSFIQSFRRNPSTGVYRPEFDGLRFPSMLLVILTHTYIAWERTIRAGGDKPFAMPDWLRYIFYSGDFGLWLFFIMSGFLITRPFLSAYARGERISTGNFFLRRLVRIEPPYFIITTLIFAAYIIHKPESVAYFGPHFLASLSYLHNIIYPKTMGINDISWSLEVEIQFYILAPVLCQVFRLKPVHSILILAVLSILMLELPWYIHFKRITLFQYAGYFFMGMLLAAIRNYQNHNGERLLPFSRPAIFLSSFFLLFGSLLPAYIHIRLAPFFLFFIMYAIITFRAWQKVFSWGVLPELGGMSYSTYLVHNVIIVLFFTSGKYIHGNNLPVFLANLCLVTLIIFTVSGFIFRFIEQPFMKLSTRFPLRKKQ